MPTPEGTRHVVDYGVGVHPLVETCRAVLVLLELDGEGNIVGPDLDALAAFVPTFDAWYRRVCGFDEGRGRMHLLYRREIGIGTAIRPRCWKRIRPVARACRDVGLGFSLTLDLRAAANEIHELSALLDDGTVGGISIAFDEDPTLFAQATDALAALLRSEIAVSFTGPMRALLDSGLLGDPRWSGRHVSIDPVLSSVLGDLTQRIEPCWRRFRLTIDSSGDLYPCFGLMGCAAGRLGNIREPIADSVLGGRPAVLDLVTLARSGPPIRFRADLRGSATGLPQICEQHRAALQPEAV